jgi:hypothetical protein
VTVRRCSARRDSPPRATRVDRATDRLKVAVSPHAPRVHVCRLAWPCPPTPRPLPLAVTRVALPQAHLTPQHDISTLSRDSRHINVVLAAIGPISHHNQRRLGLHVAPQSHRCTDPFATRSSLVSSTWNVLEPDRFARTGLIVAVEAIHNTK